MHRSAKLSAEAALHRITCRARVSRDCLNGAPTGEQFGENLPMSEDGTWNGENVVCDPCYIKLMPLTPSGAGLIHELDAAIRQARQA